MLPHSKVYDYVCFHVPYVLLIKKNDHLIGTIINYPRFIHDFHYRLPFKHLWSVQVYVFEKSIMFTKAAIIWLNNIKYS